MSSLTRIRTRGQFENVTAKENLYLNTGALSGTNLTTASTGIVETMHDTVTRPFTPGRTLANSGLLIERVERAHTPASGESHLTYPGYTGVVSSKGEKFYDRSAAISALTSRLNNFDYSSLITLAATSALASVKKPEVSGLVSIAEARETVQSLLNPLSGALKFLDKVAPTKRKRRKQTRRQKLQVAAKVAADQHLTIVFGLLPFISDIQGILKALKAIEPVPRRYTARGYASSVDVKSSMGNAVVYSDGTNTTRLYFSDQASRTVEVRAYQLYETSFSLTNALGLSLSDVPKAAWQVATLSFVVDWFVNVGDFISALTPLEGVTYILSGYTVKVTDVGVSSYNAVTTFNPPRGWSGSYNGGQQILTTITKSRVPESLHFNVGLAQKSSMHHGVLDTFKVTAAISLITQRLQKLA